MAMPDGFLPTTGFPPGYRPETVYGVPVVRLGTAGDPARGREGWTSFEAPKLSPEAVARLEADIWLFGDCYVTQDAGARVTAPEVVVVREDCPAELEGG